MTLCLFHIGLGKIEAERGQPGPGLFNEIEKAARPAANVEKTQPALVAPGEDLTERRQRLTPRGVRGTVEEHFDLGAPVQGLRQASRISPTVDGRSQCRDRRGTKRRPGQ